MCLQHCRDLNPWEGKGGMRVTSLPPPPPQCPFTPHQKHQLCSQILISRRNMVPSSWDAQSGWPWKKLGSTPLQLYRLNPATWTAWGREVRQWRTVELRPPWTGQAEMPLEIPSVSPVNLIFNTKPFLCGRTLAETWSKLISRRKVHSWNWNWDLSLPSGGPWSSWQVTTLSFVGGQP